jgi:hypothetical protein
MSKPVDIINDPLGCILAHWLGRLMVCFGPVAGYFDQLKNAELNGEK